MRKSFGLNAVQKKNRESRTAHRLAMGALVAAALGWLAEVRRGMICSRLESSAAWRGSRPSLSLGLWEV